jgi:hypothetical protein
MSADHDQRRKSLCASHHIGWLIGIFYSVLWIFRLFLPTKIVEVTKFQISSFLAWLRSTVDDRSSRSNGWDIILTQPHVCLHRTAPVHSPSDPTVQISLDPTVVIAPEFKRNDHDCTLLYKIYLTFRLPRHFS